VQPAGVGHDTPVSAVLLLAAGLGLGTIERVVPFQCSTSVFPPAVQLCALRHATPTSSVSSDPLTEGVGRIVQVLPFQCSARVVLAPASDFASMPTATQFVALEHETVVRTASGIPAGAALGTTDHFVPSQCSISVTLEKLGPVVADDPTATQFVVLVHVTALRDGSTPPFGFALAAKRQLDPSQRSMSVPLESPPTATQSVGVAHDTPARLPFGGPAGLTLGMIDTSPCPRRPVPRSWR